ncbi:TY1B-A [Symbiodinium sp. CCMP2592]|nr:TY1B-A [Symbiodinium sp. CCMP2592]
MNLAASLLRTGAHIEEVEDLCSEVLARQPSNAKALFRRGCARQILAKREGDGRPILQAAKKDLLQAAKLEPQNRQAQSSPEEGESVAVDFRRQVRLALKELQEALAEQLESGVSGVSSILGRPRLVQASPSIILKVKIL